MKTFFRTVWELCKAILQILLLASLSGFIAFLAMSLPEWIRDIIVYTFLGLGAIVLILASYLKAKELSDN